MNKFKKGSGVCALESATPALRSLDEVTRRAPRGMTVKEKGRSMVEMLGVLAVIGVLSAGALAGYSKAMFQHRVNQTIDVFSQVLQRTVELEQKNLNGIDLGYQSGSAENMIKYGLLPDCKKTKGDWSDYATACQLPIGELQIDFSVENSSTLYGEFSLAFHDVKSCIAFTSAGWEKIVPVEWWFPNGSLSISADTYLYYPTQNINEVKMDDIIHGCNDCDLSTRCDFYLVVRNEL